MANSIEKDLAALAAINTPRITARYGSWDSVEKRVGFYEANAQTVFGKRAVSAMSRLVDKGLVRASWVEFSGLLYLFYEIRDASRP